MKMILQIILVVVIALAMAVPALAAPGSQVIKGAVVAINNDGTFSVQTSKGETIMVKAPAGYDLSTLKVGDVVLVKGVLQNDGSLAADWIKTPGADASEAQPEGSKQNSAYCEAGKQTKNHPFAEKLAEKYGVTTDWVMSKFCAGSGMGAIMLALKTAQIDGVSADALLAERSSGKGWGQIWKDLKLIGSDREVQTPPGLLKKGGPGK